MSAPLVLEFVPGWEEMVPLHELFDQIGMMMQEDAEAIVPVETGRLQDSITYFIEGTGMEAVLYFGAMAPYAAYVELGHIQWQSGNWVPAEPFIRPVLFKWYHGGEIPPELQGIAV